MLVSLQRGAIACSGGIDSLLLAIVACRVRAGHFVVVHAIGPAVPYEATERVVKVAFEEGWDLRFVNSSEFSDPNYLSNPNNRCYYCKSHLYASMRSISRNMHNSCFGTLISGANKSDLSEYRPGLEAAKEFGVRHPFIEAGMGKIEIRTLARELGLSFSELPASPCLASRLYTGTEVTRERLRAVETGEELIRLRRGIDVVRCRVRGNEMLVEVHFEDQPKIDSILLDELFAAVAVNLPQIESVRLDTRPYKSGQAFLVPLLK